MGYYKTALICMNGHAVTSNIEDYPEDFQKYCSECGESTIVQCPRCESKIRGYYECEVVDFTPYEAPSYCYECGDPYPWIENSINTFIELLEIQGGFSDEEKEMLTKSLHEITNDSPRAQVGVLRIKKVAAKVGPDVRNLMINILSGIATEKVKQELGIK